MWAPAFFSYGGKGSDDFFSFLWKGRGGGGSNDFFSFFYGRGVFSYGGKCLDDFFLFLRKGRGGQGLGHFFYGRGMTVGRSDDTVSYFLCGSRFEQGRRT